MKIGLGSFFYILDQNIPAYLVVDGSNTIVKCGPAIARLLHEDVEGRCLTEVFIAPETMGGGNPFSTRADRSTLLRSAAHGIELEGVRWNLARGTIWLLSPSTSNADGNIGVEDFPNVPANSGYFLQTQFQKLLVLELSEIATLEREQRLRADNLLKDISLIAAITSHDVCNYLQVITGSLDELLVAESPVKSRASVLRAHEASELATMLLHSMLHMTGFSRDLNAEFLLCATIAEIKLILHCLLPHHIQLELELSCTDFVVTGERGGFAASLLNLVKNSVEAIGQGDGIITISTFIKPEFPGEVFISIGDNGPGISDLEFLNSSQARFFTTKRSGSGLGLSSVRDFCNRFDWKIEMTSTGRGTVIELRTSILPTKSLPDSMLQLPDRMR